MKTIDFVLHNWRVLAWPAAVFLAVLASGWLARRLVFRALRAWARRTGSPSHSLLVDALYRPVLLWLLILAVHLAAQLSDLPAHWTAGLAKTLLALWIIALTVTAARLASMLVRVYGASAQGALPVTTLSQNVASLVVVTLGLLVLLSNLGVSITPILTALGVGGLAVALALQDTLTNFFAGIHVSVAGQIRAGDYIRLDSGQEGYVTDIGWRNTVIRSLANNLVIVPNAKLAQAIVTNYQLPEPRMSLLVPVTVGYASDPDRVERILVEEATRAAAEVPGLLAEPAPSARLIPGFGDYALGFTLNCQVAQFVDQYLVQHELRKRILKRFRSEGIEIPYPTRTIYMQEHPPGPGGEG